MADADPGTRPVVCESDSEKKLVLPRCASRAVEPRFSVGNDFLLLPHTPNDVFVSDTATAALSSWSTSRTTAIDARERPSCNASVQAVGLPERWTGVVST
jgi:hypothetical protein